MYIIGDDDGPTNTGSDDNDTIDGDGRQKGSKPRWCMINPAAQGRGEDDDSEIRRDTAVNYGHKTVQQGLAGGQDLHPRSGTQTLRERSSGEKDSSKLIRPRIPSREKMAQE